MASPVPIRMTGDGNAILEARVVDADLETNFASQFLRTVVSNVAPF